MRTIVFMSVGFRFMMVFASIFCVYFGIKYFQKIKSIRGFILLSILSSLDSFTYLYLAIIKEEKGSFLILSNYTQIIYLIIELLVITEYLIRINLTKKIDIFQFRISITLIALILLVINFLYFRIDLLIIISELIIINIFSINYHLSFYNKNKHEREKNKYLISGLFIFINMTAPYYIIQNNIESNAPYILNYINFINDLGYSILFISIIKEIKWRIQTYE